jgi:putative ABC transport system ATP-binding protein
MLKLKNLKKIYRMGHVTVRALAGVDLRIRKNEFVAIMGPSGSGKSTLMNIIGCLDSPSEGTYTLNGTEVSRLKDDELAAIRNLHLGFVFQSFNLLPRLTAQKNVALPLMYSRYTQRSRQHHPNRDEQAKEMLKLVGLENRMNHKPTELSGGEQQRVAIARALVNNPDIILADEPTGNLDSATALEIMELLKNLHRQGQTIIMVTHEQNLAAYAGRIIHLLDGRITNDTSH